MSKRFEITKVYMCVDCEEFLYGYSKLSDVRHECVQE